jgi:hypothetical protein
MAQKRFILLLVVFLFGHIFSISGAQQRPALEKGDTWAWEQMVWVTGHIHFNNHPSLGRTPANGEVIAFRRVGRGNHVVAVRANLDGRFEVFLNPGRYKIIVPYLNAERDGFVDMLAAGQPRYLNAVKKHPSGIEFNVELTLPKE